MTTTQRTAITTWSIDPAHSAAEFAIKHMMISTFKGEFRGIDGVIRIDEENPENSSVVASIDVLSLDTGVADRNAHLRSDDFFNAEKYPKITFRSTRVQRDSDTRWKIAGDITIRDVTREVLLDTEFEGRVTDPWGNDRAGFTASTAINRKDFGVRWNSMLDAGGLALGDDVRITLHIEAIRA